MSVVEKAASGSRSPIPLCALGASAGGVNALRVFFANAPADLGCAYVVIVHLAPDHPSSLSEILSLQTRMPVHQVERSVTLEPDTVYVIPPNRELVIDGNIVTARPFSGAKGRRSPIDVFFESVAAGRGDGCVVLLSGSGSDGSLGLRAVKAAGGVIFAQQPDDAEFPMMPENAIATGLVDFVCPVTELGAKVAEVIRRKRATHEDSNDDKEQQIRQILAFLRRRTGHDFSNYKRSTVIRRLARRMQVVRQDNFGGYYRYLQGDKKEVLELLSDLLISVTSFFRDPPAFAALSEKVIKPLFDKLDGDTPIRIWVIGCATGEEAYSIGMLLLEEASRRGVYPIMQVFASDIDDLALGIAREGRYPKSIEGDVSEERLRRFFVQEDMHYRVKKELRDLILFASHSALKDPPFIKLDLISCRNLLIYLQRELQRQLCALFHYALKPNGYIFLGSAETIDTGQSPFSPIDRDARIYVSLGQLEKLAPPISQFATDFRAFEHRSPQALVSEQAVSTGHAHASALEQSAPPSVLVDGAFKILHLSPNAGRFFRPAEGPFNPELPAQVRPELRVDLKLALQRAMEKRETSLSIPIRVAFDGDSHLIALHVTPLGEGDHQSKQALVLFMDLGKAPPVDDETQSTGLNRAEAKQLRQELAAAQDRLSASRREYEQATQDLRAANEELQSINEEYRSTAEELETSKEELQSINEELQTVNAELKNKLEAISTAHNDLENLVAATEIGTLFLDPNLRIRFFTPRVNDYFHVSKADIGRVITDFRHKLIYDGLEQDAAQVLQSLTPIDRSLQTNDGHWVSMQVRPYRTIDSQVNGVVVTFTDITKLKLAEQGLALELRVMERLQELSTKAAMQVDKLDQSLGPILDAIIELTNANFGCIQIHDDASNTLRIVAHRGFRQRFIDFFSNLIPSSSTVIGAAFQRRERLVVEDLEKETQYAPSREEAHAAGYRAIIATPLCTSSGKLIGMLAIHFREPHAFPPHELRIVDICARQAADAMSVYSLQQQLREADRRKDEFIAMLAHELRNPLTPIYNALQILKRGNLSAEQLEHFREMMERQAAHLLRLVDDLLDIARITRGKLELRLASLELKDAIRQAIETAMPLIEGKHQKIEVSLPEGPMPVNGDLVRLSQVFSNLLNNASKFAPQNGNITLSAVVEEESAIVRVRDDGVGLTSEHLSRAFEMFNQGERTLGGDRGGIGVGLALARGIIELHEGHIEIFSEGKDKGAEVVVKLPLMREGAAPDEHHRDA